MTKKTEEQKAMTVSDTLGQQVASIESQARAMASQMGETGIEAGDLEIPKIMLMHGMSKAVSAGQAQVGDVLNTMTNEVVGSYKAPFEIVPLKAFKTIRTYKIEGTQRKFLRVEAQTAENEKLPYEDTEAGYPIKRIHNLNFFVLLKKDMEAGEPFPAVIAFKSSTMLAGRQLATHMFKRITMNQEPYSQSLPISIGKQTKDQNTWPVFEMGKGTPVSPELKEQAKAWLIRLRSMDYHVHEADDDTDETPAQTIVQPNLAQREDSEHPPMY